MSDKYRHTHPSADPQRTDPHRNAARMRSLRTEAWLLVAFANLKEAAVMRQRGRLWLAALDKAAGGK